LRSKSQDSLSSDFSVSSSKNKGNNGMFVVPAIQPLYFPSPKNSPSPPPSPDSPLRLIKSSKSSKNKNNIEDENKNLDVDFLFSNDNLLDEVNCNEFSIDMSLNLNGKEENIKNSGKNCGISKSNSLPSLLNLQSTNSFTNVFAAPSPRRNIHHLLFPDCSQEKSDKFADNVAIPNSPPLQTPVTFIYNYFLLLLLLSLIFPLRELFLLLLHFLIICYNLPPLLLLFYKQFLF
jgi:hypothetical protein